jgi:hypothetical protein
MSAVTWQMVSGMVPELAQITDVLVQALIMDFANTALDPVAFGGENSPRLRLARVFFAGHFATGGPLGDGSGSGPVTSETLGSLTRQYGMPYLEWGMFGTTEYGRKFLAIVQGSAVRGPFVA